MKFRIKVIIIVIGVAAIMAIVLSMGAKSLFREIDEEQLFGMEVINEIQVTMSSTPIHIIRTETGNELKFHYYGKSLQEIKLVSEIKGKTLLVSAKRKYVFLGTCEVTCLDIYVPAEYNRKISTRTSSGAVRIDTIDLAEFTLNTSSGGLEAERISAGKISLNTTSGKLNIKELCANELKIKGTSSSINIGESTVEDAGIKTTSGSVFITCKEFEGQNVSVETTSGNITLGLPGTAEFLIDAAMTSGKFQSDFPVDMAGNTDKRKITGRTGTENNKVSLQTTSGNIKILKNDR
jgi:lia operon protein LiaG